MKKAKLLLENNINWISLAGPQHGIESLKYHSGLYMGSYLINGSLPIDSLRFNIFAWAGFIFVAWSCGLQLEALDYQANEYRQPHSPYNHGL